MKTTSESCALVAALIATVVFSAAFQLPGGLNNTGSPNLVKSVPFTVPDGFPFLLQLLPLSRCPFRLPALHTFARHIPLKLHFSSIFVRTCNSKLFELSSMPDYAPLPVEYITNSIGSSPPLSSLESMTDSTVYLAPDSFPGYINNSTASSSSDSSDDDSYTGLNPKYV